MIEAWGNATPAILFLEDVYVSSLYSNSFFSTMLKGFKMAKLITVFGSTGNQGGSVVRAILNHSELSKEWKIRGITRNANKPDAQALVKQGVEMVSVS